MLQDRLARVSDSLLAKQSDVEDEGRWRSLSRLVRPLLYVYMCL